MLSATVLAGMTAAGCGHASSPPNRWTVYNQWLFSVVAPHINPVSLQVNISNPQTSSRLQLRGADLISDALKPIAPLHVETSQQQTFYQYSLLWNARVVGTYQAAPVRVAIRLTSGEQSFALGKAYTRVIEHPVTWLEQPYAPGGEAGQPDYLTDPHYFDFQFANRSDLPVRMLGLETAGGFQFSKIGYVLNSKEGPGGYPKNAEPLTGGGVLIPPHATCNVYTEFKQPSGYLNDLIQVAAVLEKGDVRGEEIVGPALYTVNYFLNGDPSAYYPALNVTS